MTLTKTGIKWFIFSILTAIISFVGMVYFSRILGARMLGIYFLFLSVLTVFNLFTNIGLQGATFKRISEGTQQSEIATVSLIFRLSSFSLFALIILIFEDHLDLYMGASLSLYFILILGLTQFSDIFREILHGEQKVGIGGAYDFIVTAKTEEIAKEVKELIKDFLKGRGLELSDEKTIITHIDINGIPTDYFPNT